MPIYQTNLWVCEVCHKQVPDCKEVGTYADPVVGYPPGGEWGFLLVDGKEVLACPACMAAAVEPENHAGATLTDVQVIDYWGEKMLQLWWSDGSEMSALIKSPFTTKEVADALTRLYIPLRREEG